MTDSASPPVPRGRHAPPLEVRVARQHARLLSAAAAVFARTGYAEASAEAISREAGMSKATFYEHFANKEECILALFDATADIVVHAVGEASFRDERPEERRRAGVGAFLEAIVDFPDEARTFLIEIIGAGPVAAQRRAEILDRFADLIYTQNHLMAEQLGTPRLRTRADAFAIVGAIAELAARHVRSGEPEDIFELAPVIERLHAGVLWASDPDA